VKHPKLPQWLTPDIIQAMAHRDQLKKSKKFAEYKKIRNQIKNMVRDSKRSYFNKLVENKKDTLHLWRALNALIKGKKSHSSDIPTHITPDQFNSQFLSIADTLVGNITNDYDYTCPDTLKQFCKEKLEHKEPLVIPHIAVHEVGKYILNLPNKKSSGPDEISNRILKLSLPYTVEAITYIFNLCISQNTFPLELKKAKVIPLPKSKQTTDLNNYRPISLLSVLSKILERHIHVHLSHYLEHNALLHPFQSGFRQYHSCTSALSLLTHNCLSAINKSHLSGTVFLDLSKAFDLVDHSILMKKLEMYLGNSNSILLLKSFITERTQRVYLNGSYSNVGTIQHGVPQGSVLGPILFCLYINDLPFHITNPHVTCHMLADDTTLQTSSKNHNDAEIALQEALNDTALWCSTNRMVVNPKKSKSMLITTRQKHQLSTLSLNLTLNGNIIDQVSEHKHLGVIIDDKLRWNAQVDHVCKIVSKNLFLLSKLQSIITLEARKLYYHAHIQPHFDYASIVWDGLSDALFKKLNSLHRRAAKLINPDKSMTTDEKMITINMLPLDKHFFYVKAIYMYKVLNHNAPTYLNQLFSFSSSHYSAHKLNLKFPKPRLDIFKTSLCYDGVAVWNSLPIALKTLNTITAFKHQLFAYIIETAYK
jgi:hypothetical protein